MDKQRDTEAMLGMSLEEARRLCDERDRLIREALRAGNVEEALRLAGLGR